MAISLRFRPASTTEVRTWALPYRASAFPPPLGRSASHTPSRGRRTEAQLHLRRAPQRAYT
eukprot:472896-Alexandrium_andersonii.AAC.1